MVSLGQFVALCEYNISLLSPNYNFIGSVHSLSASSHLDNCYPKTFLSLPPPSDDDLMSETRVWTTLLICQLWNYMKCSFINLFLTRHCFSSVHVPMTRVWMFHHVHILYHICTFSLFNDMLIFSSVTRCILYLLHFSIYHIYSFCAYVFAQAIMFTRGCYSF